MRARRLRAVSGSLVNMQAGFDVCAIGAFFAACGGLRSNVLLHGVLYYPKRIGHEDRRWHRI